LLWFVGFWLLLLLFGFFNHWVLICSPFPSPPHPITNPHHHPNPPQQQFLPHADLVVVMLNGRIAHQGSYQELVAAGVDIAAFVPPPAEPIDDDAASEGAGELQRRRSASIDQARPTSRLSHQGSRESQARRQGSGGGGAASRYSVDDQEEGRDAVGPLRRGAAASMIQLMELPRDMNRTLMQGGSFASHKPMRAGDRLGSEGDDGEGGGGGVAAAAAAAVLAARKGGDLEAALSEEGSEEGSEEESEEEGVKGKKGGSRKGRIVLAEHRAKGRVRRLVYLAYLSSWGPFFLLPIAITLGEPGRGGRGLVFGVRGFKGCFAGLLMRHHRLLPVTLRQTPHPNPCQPNLPPNTPCPPSPQNAPRCSRGARTPGAAELCALPLVQRHHGLPSPEPQHLPPRRHHPLLPHPILCPGALECGDRAGAVGAAGAGVHRRLEADPRAAAGQDRAAANELLRFAANGWVASDE